MAQKHYLWADKSKPFSLHKIYVQTTKWLFSPVTVVKMYSIRHLVVTFLALIYMKTVGI